MGSDNWVAVGKGKKSVWESRREKKLLAEKGGMFVDVVFLKTRQRRACREEKAREISERVAAVWRGQRVAV